MGNGPSRTKITKRIVDAARPAMRDHVVWDNELLGFGLRVRPSGAKAYVVQYRAGRGRGAVSRKVTIGRHGSPWTPDTAREEAKRLLGIIAHGGDPAADRAKDRRDLTVTELCDLYIAEGCDQKKPSTIATDLGRIERHIKPLLGRKRINALTRSDIERFLRDVAQGKTAVDEKTRKRGRAIVRGGRGTATRTTGLLGGILGFAVSKQLIAENPTAGVKRYADRSGTRYLDASELIRLGAALRNADAAGANPNAIAIIRLLALTGARRDEIRTLRWNEVRIEDRCLLLSDSKTGAKVIHLGAPAVEILAGLRVAPMRHSEFVFPDTNGAGSYQGLPKVWRRVRVEAGLEDVRLHDLRHSFASVGVTRGGSLPIIGALLGHSDAKTTQRYAHLSDDPVRSAADLISSTIAESLNGSSSGEVVPIRK